MVERITNDFSVKIPEPESLYIWLDLLGFSNELEKRENKEGLSKKLEIFRTTFSNISEKTMYLSDGILISIDILRTPWDIDKIGNIFKQLAEGQMNFFINHYEIIRGGIGVGETISDDNWKKSKFISRGMAKAYALESKKISWPIIGMDEDVLDVLCQKTKVSKERALEYFHSAPSVNAAGDTIYFIEFAKQIKNINQNHKTKIKIYFYNKFEEFEKKEYPNKVRLKYIWLYKYFKQTWGIEISNYKEWVL